MDAWKLDELLDRRAGIARPYLEFVRSGSLSAGLYVLAAGEIDRQRPHTEDEVYYVVAGKGRFTAADDTRPVESGAVIFVAAAVPHRFHDIEEELRIVVFFAPPEESMAPTSP